MKKIIIFIVLVVLIIGLIYFFYLRREQAISCLSYTDICKLSTQQKPQGRLFFKLQKQLSTPYVFNQNYNKTLNKPYLRIAHWNIERGFNIEKIKNIFTRKVPVYNKEISDFIKSDIISLNEADIGMPRTRYKNVVHELASAINYNYAFATEFIELSPVLYKENIDSGRYLGLHGNALLSRYPIKNAWIIRLPEYYKWYESEINKKSPLEYARRAGAKAIFKENILNEVRHGGRNALVANIELPNKEIITVVSVHLEDRCFAVCRFNQFKYLLDHLKGLRRPVVIAGDLNTTTTDSTPTSFKKEFAKRIKDPHFVARQIAFAAIPGVPIAGSLISVGLSKLFQYKDPASPSIPVLFPNEERKLFNYVKDFKFSDGEGFDTNGDSKKSSNGKIGLFANSNERQLKGFESTFKFEEPRLIAYFKLDWFFVKPKGKRFQPFNGQTLKLVNEVFGSKISDHDPITVDLTL